MKCFRVLLITALTAMCALAQNTPSFEVASIKPNRSGDRRMGIQMAPGGRFVATNVTVKQLIIIAYRIRDQQISGGPSWITSEHYDISAKPEAKATPDQVNLMLRSLLADRFQLTLRKESKEMPVYVLTVAKNGPKLEEAKDQGPATDDAPAEPGRGPGPGARLMRMGRGELSAQGVAVSDFSDQLGRVLGRNVIDKTGLAGKYNFTLKWTPDDNKNAAFRGPGDGPPGAPGAPAGAGADAPPPDANGPTIFAAIQEQLGLKLEAQKGPVDIYVIDRVEKPAEN